MNPFFPPRPGVTLLPALLKRMSSEIWLAQRKFEGQRNLIYIKGDHLEFWSRHPENGFRHKNFTIPPELRKNLLQLRIPAGIEVVIDSELLHAKTKGISPEAPPQWRQGVKNTVVLFDILYWNGYLANETQEDRLKRLFELCGCPMTLEPGGRALQVFSNVWLAETLQNDFFAEYHKMLLCPEVEGLVLRRRNSVLREGNPTCGKRLHEVSWMIRARRPKKNFAF